jgi:hypothetical protein
MTFEMQKKPSMFSPTTFHEEGKPISPKKPTIYKNIANLVMITHLETRMSRKI